jgi:hypothetical protein
VMIRTDVASNVASDPSHHLLKRRRSVLSSNEAHARSAGTTGCPAKGRLQRSRSRVNEAWKGVARLAEGHG